MNKAKRDGTWYETHCRKRNQKHGHQSYRLAEGGSGDGGDVALQLPDGTWVVVECKWRQTLGVHTALEKAEGKVTAADLPFLPAAAVLFWKRTVRRDGNVRRSAVGCGEVVVMSPDTFYMLIGDSDG